MNERHTIWESTMKTSTRQNSLSSLAIACATLMTALTPPLHAGEIVGPDITVRYADLAIESEQGASRLLQRIEWAAQRVCARLDHGTLASRTNAKACRQTVAAAAVQKVNHPMLQAVYDSAKGARPPVASLVR
jgi:UrcA family protein